jgi:cell shape-determining protein MreC
MADSAGNQTLRATTLGLLIALMLAVLPTSVTGRLRDLVRAGIRPGQEIALSAKDRINLRWGELLDQRLARIQSEADSNREQRLAAELRERRFELAAGQLRERLDEIARNGAVPVRPESSAPLLTARTVEARILGNEVVSMWKSRQLVGLGGSDGLMQDQWVLNESAPLIDVGGDHFEVTEGLPVYAGRTVVGRVAEAGRWVSSIEPVTSRGFRAPAAVYSQRELSEGSVASGLIEGTGDGLCRLSQVPATESVEVGDRIYSQARDPSDSVPMFFGTVIDASIQPGSLHWNIVVRPGIEIDRLRTVQVVVPTINPLRLIGSR